MEQSWEDVVEVSFTTPTPQVLLMGWGGGSRATLPLGAVGTFRVRYSARGMDAGRAADTRGAGEPELDRYALQFWAPPAADLVVRQASEIAAYWHEFARTLPRHHRPRQRRSAAAERAEAEQALRAQQAAAARRELRQWSGRLPSPRLRALGGNVLAVARRHRDLPEQFEALGPVTQRAAARSLARRAFELAELDALDWVRPALAAMDRGDRLPPPFTTRREAHARARPAGTRTRAYAVVVRQGGQSPTPGPRRIHRPSFAIPAIFAAVDPDPLRALVDSFHHAAATFDDRQDRLMAELRDRFLD